MKNKKSGEVVTAIVFSIVGLVALATAVSMYINRKIPDDGSLVVPVPFEVSTNSVVK